MFGCLGVLIGLTTLVAISGWFGYIHYMRPWFLGARERVYEKVPQLEALENAILEDGDLSGLQRDLTGNTDPAAFPADVALPDDPLVLTTRSSEERALAVAETRGRTTAALAAALRSEMQSLGWSRVAVPDPEDGVALRFERGDGAGRRIAAYELVPQENDRVRVWVRVTHPLAAPQRSVPR